MPIGLPYLQVCIDREIYSDCPAAGETCKGAIAMQASRTCPTCHRTVDASLEYCPFCHNAVQPALLDSLHWMYRTIQDLDRRIALGQGSQTMTELRNDISAEYLAKRTDSGAVTVDASVPISGASSTPATSPAP